MQKSCQVLSAVCENPGRNRVNSALIWPYENEKVVPKVVPIPARNLLLKPPSSPNSASNIRLEYFRMACSPGKSLEVADHEELCFCDRCQNREAEGERRAAKRQAFCWRATTGKRGPRGADQKRSRVSSRRRRRQRTSQRSPSIHVRFHAPGPSHRQLGVRAPIDKRTSHRFRTRSEVSSWPSSAVARRGWSVSARCG